MYVGLGMSKEHLDHLGLHCFPYETNGPENHIGAATAHRRNTTLFLTGTLLNNSINSFLLEIS